MRELLRTTRDAEEMLLASVTDFARLRPDGKELQKFFGIALQVLDQNPALLKTTQASFRNCLFECLRLDLEPQGALGHCYLIPYGDTCTLQVGYKGLIQLVQRDGGVQGVWAHVVYKDEVEDGKFVVHEGTRHEIIHDRDPFRKEVPEGVVGAYACFRLPSGRVEFDTMGLDRIIELRRLSRGSMNPDSPWNTNPLEMYKKCPIKRGSKRVPQLGGDRWQRFLRLEERQGEAEEHKVEVIDVEPDLVAVHSDEPPKPDPVITEPVDARRETREDTHARVKKGWEMYKELGGTGDDLNMDRELDDYLNPKRTTDSEMLIFRNQLIRAVQRRKREK